jgi:hypothetical protein
MLSEVPIVKRVKVKPAGSATAGVSVSFFFSLSADKFKEQHINNSIFFGGGIVLVTVSGDTHLPYDGVQPTTVTRFHLCIAVFIHGSSDEERYTGVGVRTHLYSEEDAYLRARYIGVGMRTYSSSGLVAASASS